MNKSSVSPFGLWKGKLIATFLIVIVMIAVSFPAVAEDDFFEDGKALYIQGRYASALKMFMVSAKNGNADSQVWLGRMFKYGRGVRIDDKIAENWFRLAAASGNPEGKFELARLLETRDEKSDEAFSLYEELASNGFARAQLALGRKFRHGRGVEKDDSKAFRWLLQAAEQGIVNAQKEVSFMYLRGEGVETNEVEAKKWGERAELQGKRRANMEDIVKHIIDSNESIGPLVPH